MKVGVVHNITSVKIAKRFGNYTYINLPLYTVITIL